MFVYAGGLVNLALIQTAEADIQETLINLLHIQLQVPHCPETVHIATEVYPHFAYQIYRKP